MGKSLRLVAVTGFWVLVFGFLVNTTSTRHKRGREDVVALGGEVYGDRDVLLQDVPGGGQGLGPAPLLRDP